MTPRGRPVRIVACRPLPRRARRHPRGPLRAGVLHRRLARRPSSASTSRAAPRSRCRRRRPTASRRAAPRSTRPGRSSSAGSTASASPRPRWSPRARTGSSSRCPARTVTRPSRSARPPQLRLRPVITSAAAAGDPAVAARATPSGSASPSGSPSPSPAASASASAKPSGVGHAAGLRAGPDRPSAAAPKTRRLGRRPPRAAGGHRAAAAPIADQPPAGVDPKQYAQAVADFAEADLRGQLPVASASLDKPTDVIASLRPERRLEVPARQGDRRAPRSPARPRSRRPRPARSGRSRSTSRATARRPGPATPPSTTSTVTPNDPANNVAVVLDSKIISAPAIQGMITGQTQITGNFTQSAGRGPGQRAQVRRAAADLRAAGGADASRRRSAPTS